jgi:hypothetical protein
MRILHYVLALTLSSCGSFPTYRQVTGIPKQAPKAVEITERQDTPPDQGPKGEKGDPGKDGLNGEPGKSGATCILWRELYDYEYEEYFGDEECEDKVFKCLKYVNE